MRTLIQYIRSLFCKHDFEMIANVETYEKESSSLPIKRVRVYRCKKCGYVQRVKL